MNIRIASKRRSIEHPKKKRCQANPPGRWHYTRKVALYAAFTIEGQEFGAMDSAHQHDFTFNKTISFIVYCNTQEEIDYYWEKLSLENETEIDRLGAEFNNQPVDRHPNVYKWLSENEFYRDFMLDHYSGLINR